MQPHHRQTNRPATCTPPSSKHHHQHAHAPRCALDKTPRNCMASDQVLITSN
ncbi:hypothetical protein M441DRAFT_56720 [Trichoderma asperellum CBS 433.97]|uniref:Uncharacterized protein n=1 Tax=Trichoderma asperellum (strain ATCC 204424 / CBS 433.97 / NBRC 101777) TaxID=1042311 RepID=A0A2T3ZAY0_TRIA4|nr:hypothetical protein M441DRAFT_56720 [Trichoderma asperellum CBS 433.97]PTB41930.1 hypothetical protein M441DRAFT_56720 [Trichoderma asperellum CBS 433.97]